MRFKDDLQMKIDQSEKDLVNLKREHYQHKLKNFNLRSDINF